MKRCVAQHRETIGQHHGRQGKATSKHMLVQLREFGTSFEIDAQEGITNKEGSLADCSLRCKIHFPDGGDVRVPDGEDDGSFTERQ